MSADTTAARLAARAVAGGAAADTTAAQLADQAAAGGAA